MYKYEEQKERLFTVEVQTKFLQVRDHVHILIRNAGAFTLDNAITGIGGDSWLLMACIDRLCEIGEIREIKHNHDVAAQDRVFEAGILKKRGFSYERPSQRHDAFKKYLENIKDNPAEIHNLLVDTIVSGSVLYKVGRYLTETFKNYKDEK